MPQARVSDASIEVTRTLDQIRLRDARLRQWRILAAHQRQRGYASGTQ